MSFPKFKLPKRKPRVKPEKPAKPTKVTKVTQTTLDESGEAKVSTTKRRIDESESAKGPIASQTVASAEPVNAGDVERHGLSKKERRRLLKQQERRKAS